MSISRRPTVFYVLPFGVINDDDKGLSQLSSVRGLSALGADGNFVAPKSLENA